MSRNSLCEPGWRWTWRFACFWVLGLKVPPPDCVLILFIIRALNLKTYNLRKKIKILLECHFTPSHIQHVKGSPLAAPRLISLVLLCELWAHSCHENLNFHIPSLYRNNAIVRRFEVKRWENRELEWNESLFSLKSLGVKLSVHSAFPPPASLFPLNS